MLTYWGMLDGGMDLDVCGPLFVPTGPSVPTADRECAYVDVPMECEGEMWVAVVGGE